MTLDEYLLHMKEHMENDYACLLCGHRYGDIDNLSAHMEFHPDFPETWCKVCGVDLGEEEERIKHVDAVHRKKESKDKPEQMQTSDEREGQK